MTLVVVTLGLNAAIHRTLNAHILTTTATTYGNLLQGHLREFFTTLRYAACAYGAWQFLRFIAGRPGNIVTRWKASQWLLAGRAFAVYVLCGTAFSNVHGFVHQLSPIDRDTWLVAADRSLFLGREPLKLLEPLVTDQRVAFFVQVYLSFFMVAWLPMILFLHWGMLRAFRDTIVSLLLTIWIGYVGYVAVPAIGPQYVLRHEFTRPIFNVEGMLAQGTDRLPRDCFPSLHTAVSVVVLVLMWRYGANRLYRVGFAIWCLAIVFSTMYLRIHYVTDVIAGTALALGATALGPRLNAWWDAHRRPGTQADVEGERGLPET